MRVFYAVTEATLEELKAHQKRKFAKQSKTKIQTIKQKIKKARK